MNRKIKLITLGSCLLFGLGISAYAQEINQIDSLKSLLKNPSLDSLKGQYCRDLMFLYTSADLDSSIFYGFKAIATAEARSDSSLMADVYHGLGTCHWYKSDFVKAMEYYLLAASYYEKQGLEGKSISSQINVGLIYLTIGDLPKAKGLLGSLIPQLQNHELYLGLANVYNYLGTAYDSETNYDSAIYVMEECVKYARLANSLQLEARGISGLGIVYAAKGDYAKAAEYQYMSLDMEQKVGNELGVMDTYIILGALEAAQKNYRKAEEYFHKAESSRMMKGNYLSQGKLYQQMTNMYDEMGDVRKSYEVYKKLVSATDSIKNMDKIAIINELNEKYESEKKSNEILNLKKDQELASLTLNKERTQKFLFGSIAVFLFLVIGLVIFFYAQLRNSKIKLDSQNKIISDVNNELIKSAEALRISNETKDKLFALVAHDLRGPLTSLRGIGEILDFYTRKGDQEKLGQIILQIDQSTASVNHLLDNLLKWALAQSNGIQYTPSRFSLNQLVLETVDLFRENFIAKDVTLKYSLLETSDVFGDYHMLSTVLRNLISNALKFSNQGGEVSVCLNMKDTNVEVVVKDDGTGISQEVINKLQNKEMIYSTPGTASEKGTGLGLSLCNEFIELHQSKLNITSPENGGTVVSFDLPSEISRIF